MASPKQHRMRILGSSLVAPTLASALALVFVFALICVAPRATQAQTLTVLHNFTGGGDGSTPYAGLSMDRAGNLYGTTSAGNSSVFRLSHAGSGWILTSLYTFKGGSDGSTPYSRVIIGPDGILYGTTSAGGGAGCNPDGCGIVYNLRPPITSCKTALCPWIETVL